MRILDRYILKSVLGLFIGCLLGFFSLYIIIDIFSHLDEILKQHVGLQILAEYYFSYLPIIFVQVAPVAALLAILYTFGKLNHTNEIIAMRSAGLSIYQIGKPVIILGMVMSMLVFFVNDRFVPRSLSITEKIKDQMERGSKKIRGKEQEVISNMSMYGLKNRLYFINRFTPSTNTMEGITILEQDQHQNLTRKIVANKGTFRGNNWVFYQTITYNFDQYGQIRDEPQYMEEEVMDIPESPQDFLSQRQRPDFMDIEHLTGYIKRLADSGATSTVRNFRVDLYQRFTMPLTTLIIILLGLPFSLITKKRATGMSSVGLSLGVGFSYYVINAIGIALGKSGILTPLLAVSTGHLIALSLGLYLIHKLP